MTAVVAGGLSLVAGAVLMMLTPQGEVGAGLVAGLVVAGGGLVLLFRDRLRLSGRAMALAAVVTGSAGTVAALAVSSTRMCCMFAYGEMRGWPYAWLSRTGVADTPAEAIGLAEAGGWGLMTPVRLVGSAVVWSYAGLILIAVVSRLRGTRRE